MHLKCAWARRSIGIDQLIDNHVSITITKRNFDNLVIHPWFRYQRTRACWYRAIGCIARIFENSNNCVLGGFLTHERLACM